MTLPRRSDTELETFTLSRGLPSIQLYSRFHAGDSSKDGTAWLSVVASGFTAGERVLVTHQELDELAAMFTRYAAALRAEQTVESRP